MLIHDLHKTAELPELNDPLSKLEEDVIPNRSKSQAMIQSKSIKLNKEKKIPVDHLKSVAIKDQLYTDRVRRNTFHLIKYYK